VPFAVLSVTLTVTGLLRERVTGKLADVVPEFPSTTEVFPTETLGFTTTSVTAPEPARTS
jgi:hypothetical protein